MGFIKKHFTPPPPSESTHSSTTTPSPGGPMSCGLYNINLSLPEMLSQPLRLAWLQQQLTHSKIIADPNLRWLFALSPTPCHDGPHFTLWIGFIWTYLVIFTINLIRGKYRFPNLDILFGDSSLVSVHATKLKKKQSHILPFSMFTPPFWKSRVTWHGFDYTQSHIKSDQPGSHVFRWFLGQLSTDFHEIL